jgi:hypothetical protein
MRNWCWLIGIGFLSLWIGVAPARADYARLSLDDLTVNIGASGTVTARLDCVPQCSLFALTLSYDPAVIQVMGVQVGDYLGSVMSGQAVVVENQIDNTVGEVRLAAASMGVPPAVTDNTLFRLEIVGLRFGSTAFIATRAEFGDTAMPPLSLVPTITSGQIVVLNLLPTATLIPLDTPPPTRMPLPSSTFTPPPTWTRTPVPTTTLQRLSNTTRTSAPSATRLQLLSAANIGGLALAELGTADIAPYNGQLISEADGNIELDTLNVSLRDFAIQFDVVIPSPIPAAWDFALVFRYPSTNNQYRLIFSEANRVLSWTLRNRVDGESDTIQDGTVALPLGSVISLQLMALDTVGVLFVNDDFLTTLDLSARRTSGDIGFAIDMYSDTDGVSGTRAYRNLALWELEPTSSRSGSLLHDNDGGIELSEATVNAAHFAASATFGVPFTTGTWDIGFLFRDRTGNDEYRLIVTSTGRWYLYRPGVIDASHQVGQTTLLRTARTSTNMLTLIALGDMGIALLNGAYMATLDLSDSSVSGPISAATGIMAGHEISGQTTTFSDFRVWR